MIKMVRLCIFDLDGTLLDTIQDLAVSSNVALEKHGLPIHPVEQYKRFVGNGIPKLIERASGYSADSTVYQAVYQDFMEYYNEHSTDYTQVYPGILSVLNQLSGREILTAVLSNKADLFVKELVKRFFPDFSFRMVLGKRSSFPVKPDPKSLNFLVQSCEVEKKDCIYIGDSDVDVQTAHNAGIPCIGAEWGFRGREELSRAGADYLAENPFDILRMV